MGLSLEETESNETDAGIEHTTARNFPKHI
jgi:hypothetical protein